MLHNILGIIVIHDLPVLNREGLDGMTEGFEVCLPAGTWVGPLIQVEPSIQLLQALEWRMNWWIFMDFYWRMVTFFLRYYPLVV